MKFQLLFMVISSSTLTSMLPDELYGQKEETQLIITNNQFIHWAELPDELKQHVLYFAVDAKIN